jgi:tRNA-uridine 2-sulfurtransferase
MNTVKSPPHTSKTSHIVVGLSGGVDSSVAAHLLKTQGHQVTGMFMKNWDDDDDADHCTTRQDWLDAASVADKLGIDIEAANFAAQYKDRVFAYFLQEYAAGRTPNPDILCNTEIKFKAFLDDALKLGASKMATGHYAGVREQGGLFQLLRAHDDTKDQSYFLHGLNQAQLSKAVFPLHTVRKTQVRELAAQIGLHNHAKKDSTGICFIGERPFREFLNRYLPSQAGDIRDADGKKIGTHMGLAFYTLGQRKGLGVGGLKGRELQGEDAVWFVARKDLASNTLYAVQGHHHPWLLSHTITVQTMHWVAGEPPQGEVLQRLSAKTRYRQTDV